MSEVWNGSAWVEITGLEVWNGSSWVEATGYEVWNGSAWDTVMFASARMFASATTAPKIKEYDIETKVVINSFTPSYMSAAGYQPYGMTGIEGKFFITNYPSNPREVNVDTFAIIQSNTSAFATKLGGTINRLFASRSDDFKEFNTNTLALINSYTHDYTPLTVGGVGDKLLYMINPRIYWVDGYEYHFGEVDKTSLHPGTVISTERSNLHSTIDFDGTADRLFAHTAQPSIAIEEWNTTTLAMITRTNVTQQMKTLGVYKG